jgi:arylsulfatase A-like enzyme
MDQATLPNIVLIVMDTVPAKRCSVYGHERDTTPGLRSLASQGFLYRWCFTPATWTIPSHASLFTGLYPWEHGCKRSNFVLQLDQYYSLAEILQQMGYYTVALSSNTLICPEFQFHVGFDEFYAMEHLFNSKKYNEAISAIKAYKSQAKGEIDRLFFLFKYSLKNRHLTLPLENLLDRLYERYWGRIFKKSSAATERSIKIGHQLFKKRLSTNKPLFLFINFMETHSLYNPPKQCNNIIKLDEARKAEILKIQWTDLHINKNITKEQIHLLTLLYEQELSYLDSRIQLLYNYCDQLGLANNTMFIVTADHGECFGEHRTWAHAFGVYNELIHVPLIIKYPHSFGLTGESDKVVQLHDLFATILDVVNAPMPLPESSVSLLGPPREFALAELSDPSININACKQVEDNFQPDEMMQACRCIIDQDLYKLIQWADGRKELYDLRSDYAETKNRIHDPQLQSANEQLESRMAEIRGPVLGEM